MSLQILSATCIPPSCPHLVGAGPKSLRPQETQYSHVLDLANFLSLSLTFSFLLTLSKTNSFPSFISFPSHYHTREDKALYSWLLPVQWAQYKEGTTLKIKKRIIYQRCTKIGKWVCILLLRIVLFLLFLSGKNSCGSFFKRLHKIISLHHQLLSCGEQLT